MTEQTFYWVVTGGVVVVSLFFAIMGIAALVIVTYLKRLMAKVEPILKSAAPIAQHVQDVVAITKPRILKITSDATEVSALVVTEAKRYAEISKDVGARAKVKIARFDGAVDDTMDQMQEAKGAVKSAVLRPLHHIEGVMAGVRTAVQTYASGGSRGPNYGTPQYRVTQDEEMFI